MTEAVEKKSTTALQDHEAVADAPRYADPELHDQLEPDPGGEVNIGFDLPEMQSILSSFEFLRDPKGGGLHETCSE